MRERVVEIARDWVGTPYHHQASRKGAGCDCLGLIRGVWRELYGRDAETPPPYTRDWAEQKRSETLLDAARRHLLPVSSLDATAPGDVLIFRIRADAMAKHAGILTEPARMVHAQEGAGVVEVHLGPWWRRRVAAVFAFPEDF